MLVNKMGWDKFADRKRYIKDENGQVIDRKYDRMLGGCLAKNKPWLHRYQPDDVVTVFQLGDSIVFTWLKDSNTIYTNANLGGSARQYIDFFKQECNIENEQAVNDLPTAQRVSRGGAPVNRESALLKAMANLDSISL